MGKDGYPEVTVIDPEVKPLRMGISLGGSILSSGVELDFPAELLVA